MMTLTKIWLWYWRTTRGLWRFKKIIFCRGLKKKILQIRAAEKKRLTRRKVPNLPTPPLAATAHHLKNIVTQSLSWHTCSIIVTQRDTTVASLNIHKLCISYRSEVPNSISLVCFLDFLVWASASVWNIKWSELYLIFNQRQIESWREFSYFWRPALDLNVLRASFVWCDTIPCGNRKTINGPRVLQWKLSFRSPF